MNEPRTILTLHEMVKVLYRVTRFITENYANIILKELNHTKFKQSKQTGVPLFDLNTINYFDNIIYNS